MGKGGHVYGNGWKLDFWWSTHSTVYSSNYNVVHWSLYSF